MSSKAPWHFGMKYAGQTVEWLPTDTEESYRKLIQEPRHQEHFRRHGWDQPGAITYQINSNGFRAPEFELGTANIVTLGCSYSVGIGLPVELMVIPGVNGCIGCGIPNEAPALKPPTEPPTLKDEPPTLDVEILDVPSGPLIVVVDDFGIRSQPELADCSANFCASLSPPANIIPDNVPVKNVAIGIINSKNFWSIGEIALSGCVTKMME